MEKQARLDEKIRIKEDNDLAKQARLDEKRRIKGEKKTSKLNVNIRSGLGDKDID